MPFLPASRYAVDRDFVLVGYRGVDGSVRLDCPEVVSALKHSTDLTGEASFQAFSAGFRACAARFADEGIDVTSYGLAQQVDDLEAAREALGYDRINLVSESVGTRTAMIYAWRHPERINRSVMIAANPPGNFVWDPETTDEQIARYDEYCSKDAGCRERTADFAATMSSTEIPERWFFLPIDEGNVRAASHYGLMETNVEAAPLHAPMTIDAWLSAADGDAGGFWFQSLLADFAFPTAFVWGQYASAASLDGEVANEYFARQVQPRDSNIGYAATAFGWGGGRLTKPGRPCGTRASTARCGRRRWRRSSWAVSSTSRSPRRWRRPSSSRRSRTARRSSCPGSGTRATSGTSNRKPAAD